MNDLVLMDHPTMAERRKMLAEIMTQLAKNEIMTNRPLLAELQRRLYRGYRKKEFAGFRVMPPSQLREGLELCWEGGGDKYQDGGFQMLDLLYLVRSCFVTYSLLPWVASGSQQGRVKYEVTTGMTSFQVIRARARMDFASQFMSLSAFKKIGKRFVFDGRMILVDAQMSERELSNLKNNAGCVRFSDRSESQMSQWALKLLREELGLRWERRLTGTTLAECGSQRLQTMFCGALPYGGRWHMGNLGYLEAEKVVIGVRAMLGDRHWWPTFETVWASDTNWRDTYREWADSVVWAHLHYNEELKTAGARLGEECKDLDQANDLA